MLILGIDPGQTSGWCLYNTSHGYVRAHGQFPDHLIDIQGDILRADVVVVERPVPHGATRPQVVECAYYAGRLVQKMVGAGFRVEEMRRTTVRRQLQDALHGSIRVINDRTVWAALCIIHGEGSDRKPRTRKGQVVENGGAIGGVVAHERAALAVAVAWMLRERARKELIP